jgi:hypothetical protein
MTVLSSPACRPPVNRPAAEPAAAYTQGAGLLMPKCTALVSVLSFLVTGAIHPSLASRWRGG